MRVRLCDVFLGGVFWVALFERERERDIYTTTKIHSLNDGKGAEMKKRLFLLPISRRSKEGKRYKSHTKRRRTFSFCSILLLIYSSFSRLFSFLFCGSCTKTTRVVIYNYRKLVGVQVDTTTTTTFVALLTTTPNKEKRSIRLR